MERILACRLSARAGTHVPSPKYFSPQFLVTFVASVCMTGVFLPAYLEHWLVVQVLPPLSCFPSTRHLGQSLLASQCLLHSAGTLPVQLDQSHNATAAVLDQSQAKECAGSRPQCHHINIGEDIKLLTLASLIPSFPYLPTRPSISCMTVSA